MMEALTRMQNRVNNLEGREDEQRPVVPPTMVQPAAGRIKLIPPEKFKGDKNPKDSVKVRNWIRSYESYMNKADIGEDYYSKHIDQFLSDAASNWYFNEISDETRSDNFDWEVFKDLMIRRFSPPNEELDSFSKFRNFKMKDDAKYYATHFSELLQPVAADFNDRVVMNFFLEGLNDEIKATILSRGHTELATAKEDAIACWDGLRRVQVAAGKKQKQGGSNRSGSKQPESGGSDPNKGKANDRNSLTTRCFNCQKVGHRRPDCPDRKGKE